MSNLPLISIIFPLNNWNDSSRKALHSLRKQSYTHIEILPVWYGSSNEMDSVQKVFSEKIHLSKPYFHEAINKGIEESKGYLITFIMATDWYTPDRLEKCIARLQLEQGEFIFTQVLGVDYESNPLGKKHPFVNWKQNLEFQSDLDPTIGFKLLKEMMPVSLGNVILSKRVVDRIGAYLDTEYAEYDYILRAVTYAEPIFLKEELYMYRFYENVSDPFLTNKQAVSAIHKNYLLHVHTPPENTLAPCPQYWPMAFSYFRIHSDMDKSMAVELQEAKNKQAVSPIPLKECGKETQSNGLITLLIHDLSLSGAPRVAADLALALKENGYEPNIISFSDGPLRPVFDNAHIPISFIYPNTRYWFFKPKYKKFLFLLSMACEMFRKSKQTTIAVASLTWSALFVASFLFPFRKFIWYLHDSYAPEGIVVDGLPFKLFRKCLQRKNLRFWFGSQATSAIWETAEVHGDVVYWSGIAKNNEVKKKKSIKTILSVGAGYPRKGAHFLIEAFLICIRENLIPEDVNLVIIGFSDTVQDLKDFVSDVIFKVHESGYKHRIQLVKSIEEAQLEGFYEQCDLYVQPSFLECLPLALLKAMSQGIPVITSYVDGCNEAVIDQVNGYTCPPRNSSILAKKIAYAVNNPEEAFTLGREGQKTFNEKFSLEATKPKLFETLEKKHEVPAFTKRITEIKNKKIVPLTELV